MALSGRLKRKIRANPIAGPAYTTIVSVMNRFIRKRQVAMLHTGRCGSTVIAKMLTQQSDVFWAGEVFEKYTKDQKINDNRKVIEKRIDWSRHSEWSRVYGFETKYLPQLQLSKECIDMDLDEYILLLRQLRFSQFIVLHRKNYLRRLISALVGRQKHVWHSKQEVASPEKITIDIDSVAIGRRREPLLKLFDCMDERYESLKELLTDDEALFLAYEDDILKDPRVAYRRVCDFLDLPDESPKVELSRTNPFDYEDMVTNFEEVRATLADTKYKWMLDD